MLTVEDALARLRDLVSHARSLGADAAEAVLSADASTSAQVRLGALEDLTRSESEDVSLRVFVGQQVASLSTSDMTPSALRSLAETALTIARAASPDRFAGLADPALLLTGPRPELELADSASPTADELIAMARTAEQAARDVPGITNSEGGSASAARTTLALVTSSGFEGGYASTGYGLSASVIAQGKSGMERDYAYHQARFLEDLEAPQEIGARAGERAVRRLDPAKLASGTLPVVFDRRVSASLIGHLLGAISGSAIARKSSFLLGKRGLQVMSTAVTLREEPHLPRALRSRPFDREGLPAWSGDIVSGGVLQTWLMESASARQLGEQPTGHASGGGGTPGVSVSNLVMLPGQTSPQDLLAPIKRGLYVTELIGMGVNGVTGDYSRGASGFLIEDGQIGPAISEVTIAGNLANIFMAMTPASDLERRRGIDAPTVLIDAMTIAGN